MVKAMVACSTYDGALAGSETEYSILPAAQRSERPAGCDMNLTMDAVNGMN